MKTIPVVIAMKKKEGLAQIFEILYLPLDDYPEFIQIEGEDGEDVLAIHSHFTPKGYVVFKEMPL